jgi:hypothetical protein
MLDYANKCAQNRSKDFAEALRGQIEFNLEENE